MRRTDFLRDELRTRLKKRGSAVWGYLLNLAWTMVFRDVYNVIVGRNPPFYVRLIVAVAFTVIATLITMRTTDVDELTVHASMNERGDDNNNN